jgi:hypothetical protein
VAVVISGDGGWAGIDRFARQGAGLLSASLATMPAIDGVRFRMMALHQRLPLLGLTLPQVVHRCPSCRGAHLRLLPAFELCTLGVELSDPHVERALGQAEPLWSLTSRKPPASVRLAEPPMIRYAPQPLRPLGSTIHRRW